MKILNKADSYGFFDLISVHLKTIDHLNLKLLIFVDILQVLKFDFLKSSGFWKFRFFTHEYVPLIVCPFCR